MKMLCTCLALVLLLGAVSCKKKVHQPGGGTTATPIAPTGFGFGNLRTVAVDIKLLAPDNTPVSGVPISFYLNLPTLDNGNDDNQTPVFTTRVSDKNGNISTSLVIGTGTDTLLADAKYPGILRNAKLYIAGNRITAVLGGAAGISGNFVPGNYRPNTTGGLTPPTGIVNSGKLAGMGAADAGGRPGYLVTPGGTVTGKLLSYLNASLPEGADLQVTHPQYLSAGAVSTLNITAQTDVYVTFVAEGAAYSNAIGYYTYPTNTPPAGAADVKLVNIMYPNASFYGSGGSMHGGDKIKLGNFAAGTSIGFVLSSNGWKDGANVDSTAVRFYSDTKPNPETDVNFKKHSVLLYNSEDTSFLVGFEDIVRTSNRCDQDFNDVVFYATAGTANSISTAGVAPVDKPTDTDGDGVSDIFDQYPTDGTRAYNTYYPSTTAFATIAFEDLWPASGDYDMNDLVVNYQYKFVSNGQNQVVELYGSFAVQAAGASYQNGFGVQFPFAAGMVKQVTGQKLVGSYVNLAASGVEAGQAKAVIIPFDNHQALINNFAGAYFINSKNELPKVTGDTAHVYMQFTSPISFEAFGNAPFNPFLISNQRRQYEVHLPGNAPTDKVDKKLFGTGQDASNPGAGIYYVSNLNWPWALNFPAGFLHPLEGVSISKAYLHFLDWAASGGTQYTDWYSNASPGYRNTGNLYTK